MLEIEGGALNDGGGTGLALRIDLHNPLDRPLYACASVRAIRYAAATRALEVDLAPQAPGEGSASTYLLPRIVSIGAHQRVEIDATLPRELAHVAPGSDGVAPVIERLPLHEASSVTVTVAWSDAPFAGAVSAWAKGTASFQFARTP